MWKHQGQCVATTCIGIADYTVPTHLNIMYLGMLYYYNTHIIPYNQMNRRRIV